MEKVMVGNAQVIANPLVIVGAMVNGKPSYNTIGFFGTISPQYGDLPRTLYIKSVKPHYTNIGIRETGYFSVNIPSASLIQKTDYVGLVSGHDTDKSGVFKPFFGAVDKAPMVEECPVNLLCKVIKTVEMPSRPLDEVFIGEVVETYVNKDCIVDGKLDANKIWPLMLFGKYPDMKYWEMKGSPVGAAYSEGKALIKKEAA